MEVELKLALDPADVARLREASALANARPVTNIVDALYLDTREREIARNGMALRIRRAGRRWMQCVKAGASGTGGLHSRQEWEIERPGPEVDLSLFRDTPLAELPDAGTLHERLSVAFRVTYERTAWIIAPMPGTRLEVALDVGEVRRGKHAEPVCELEIECLEGDAMAAFDLALRLNEVVALRASPVTKAQRGYRLLRGKPRRPVRAEPSRVTFDMTPAQAAAAIVAGGLDQLQANEEGVLLAADPEFVHQSRVALRRIRSALRIFRKPIGAKRANAWRRELAHAARALGEARDWDVFVSETLPAILASYAVQRGTQRLRERAMKQQSQARAAAREAVRSSRYARAILEVSRWLADPGDATDDDSLEDFAARLLRRRHQRLAADLERLAEADMAERHRARIDAKRLRYVVEGLAPALDALAARRYARQLSRLQDALGSANDAVAGEWLLQTLRPAAALGALAKHWLARRIREETSKLPRLASEITGARPFWRQS